MSLRLIGAGLGRTGTLSIKLALEQVGFGPCYHMAELFMHPTHAELWAGAADGRPEWEALLGEYASTVDYPGCAFWRDLTQCNPDAKVLLSVRDPAAWFESTQETIFSEDSLRRVENSPLEDCFAKAVWSGLRERIHDRDFMMDHFRRHNAEVERAIPPERLLVYRICEGWGPLCAFLGVPVPDKPFPRVNSREQFAQAHSQDAGQNTQPYGSEEMSDRMRDRIAHLREQN